jgi:hypothetical protein
MAGSDSGTPGVTTTTTTAAQRIIRETTGRASMPLASCAFA